MTLARTPIGNRVRVTSVRPDSELHQRLLELGVLPGVEVRMRRAAPLGDPLEIELLGYRLSLRKAEAALVEVEPFP